MHHEPLFTDLPGTAAALYWPVAFGASLETVQQLLSTETVVTTDQVHRTDVAVVDHKSPSEIAATDGLVTRTPGVALTARGADCQILFAADSTAMIIGIAHAGWKGLIAGIGATLIETMVSEGADPARIHMHIGPSIGPCHYQVDSAEAIDRFHQYFHRFGSVAAFVREGREVLDLRAAQRQLLLDAGILPKHLTIDPRCTYCASARLPSHRREGASRSQNIVGCMMIRSDGIPR